MHHDIESVHASYSYSCSIFFVLTCSLPLVLFLFLFPICCVLLVLYSSTMPRKSIPSVSPFRVQLFRNERSRETFKKLNSKRKIWAKRSVILDEVDPSIRANLESRGWLSLLEIGVDTLFYNLH